MKHLVIIGARGWGREVFAQAHDTAAYRAGEYDFKGFLDDKRDALDAYPSPFGSYPPILGTVDAYEPDEDDVFFCALGDTKWRRHYAEKILAKGGEFINVIMPMARVSPSVKLGKGIIIGPWCGISTNVEIGDFTIVHPFTITGHDVKIGAFCTVESYSFFGGYSAIGDGTTMHVRSSIIPHKRLGKNVVVGVGSAVMRNFGDGVHLFGNPAKRIEF